MGMTGEDSIREVSKIFGQLADDGGQAADSFAAVNNVLKTNLQRTFLRLNKTILDVNRQLQIQLRNSRNIQKPTSKDRITNAGKVRDTFDKSITNKVKVDVDTKDFYKQLRDTELESLFNDLADTIAGQVLTQFARLADSLGNISNVLSPLKDFLLALLATKNLLPEFGKKPRVAGFTPAPSIETDADLEKAVANSIYQRQKDIIGMSEAMSNRVSMAGQKFRESMQKSMREVNKTIEKIKNLKAIEVVDPSNTIKDEIADLNAKKSELLEAAKEQRSKMIGERRKAARPRFLTDTIGDLAINIKSGNLYGEFVKRLGKFIASIKIATAVITGSLIVALTYVTYKMLDFGKNAVPRLFKYLTEPLQEVYNFVTGPLDSAFGRITSFVSKLNPAYGEQASRALDDLSAVIGKIVLPVFNNMLGVLKVFTSTLFKNSKDFKDVMEALGSAIGTIGASVVGNFFVFLKEAGPVIQTLTQTLKNAAPIIGAVIKDFAAVLKKQMPTFNRAIKALGMILDMYLKQKLQEFSNAANLASRAAQNQARAIELFGEEAITLSMIFNNLGYYIKDFMLQLEGVFIELMGWAQWFSGRPGKGGGVFGKNFVPFEVAGGEEPGDLNFAEKAGAWLRKKIANLFGAEDLPWVMAKKREKEAADAIKAGAGDFGAGAAIIGGDFGEGVKAGVEEGFAARGAQFQEIGQLGKNLMVAAFGGGESPEEQQVGLLRIIADQVNMIVQGQNQFDGAQAVQGVR